MAADNCKTCFDELFRNYRMRIETALSLCLPLRPADEGGRVTEAARYSLLGGGKRLRPVLLLAAADMLQASAIPAGNADGEAAKLDTVGRALPFACALELIHTYSLIHDDLPCMDDDQLRRGRPTCHVVYGEAIAVLAGDLLLNQAVELMLAQIGDHNPGALTAARIIMKAAGGQGMIAGQTLDLQAEGQTIELDALRRLHHLKTGALLLAPFHAAAALVLRQDDCAISGSLPIFDESAVGEELTRFGEAIGLSFQIQDDILDATSSTNVLGKTTGKDIRDDKSTYVSLLGLNEAGKHLLETLETAGQALTRLRQFSLDTAFMSGLIDYLQNRKS